MKKFLVALFALLSQPAFAADFSGFHAGVTAGYGRSETTSGASTAFNGAVIGGALGYDVQFSPWVAGIEADWQHDFAQRSDSLGFASLNQSVPWFATLRARAGYAVGNLLLYGTGGIAWQNAILDVPGFGSTGTTPLGWTAGAGLEWMFTPRWSLRAEYLHLDSGDKSFTLLGRVFNGRVRNDIARLGVNYRF